jgi:cytoskeletal protein RodZ
MKYKISPEFGANFGFINFKNVMAMKTTAIIISLLVIGAFAANAQDETKSQSTTKTQSTTKSQSSTNDPSSTETYNQSNSEKTSSPEGTMNSEGTSGVHNGTKLQISDLPKAISQNIASGQKGWTPQEVYKFDNQGATAYEVVVKMKDEEKSLIYDANGNLLRTEQKSSVGVSK